MVIADDALMDEAADATEIFGGRTPSLFRFARSATEATIVVGQETAQDLAGGGQIGGAREAEFTGKEIPAYKYQACVNAVFRRLPSGSSSRSPCHRAAFGVSSPN
jgi:hypothetical protein